MVFNTTKLNPIIIDHQKFYYSLKTRSLIVQQGTVHGEALNGKYYSYYYNKKLKEKGRFKYGLKVGEWLVWNDEGVLLKQQKFKKGMIHGIQYFYRRDKSIGISKYKYGKLHGDSLVLTIQGDTLNKYYYENGLLKEKSSNIKSSTRNKKRVKKEKTKKQKSSILKNIKKAEKTSDKERKISNPFKGLFKKWFKNEETE